jgi:outer membrane PBP1 activator LpoA protein
VDIISPESLLELAKKSTGDKVIHYRLGAAQLFAEREQFEQAWEVLNSLNKATLAPDQLARTSLVTTRLFLYQDQPDQAMAELSNPRLLENTGLLEQALQLKLSQAKAEVLDAKGSHFAAARERIFIHPLLHDETERSSNSRALWRSLMKIPVPLLRQHSSRAIDGDTRGWLELALINKELANDIASQASNLADWEARWSQHPGAIHLPDELAMVDELAVKQPGKIALLLPLSGPLASSGQALREGFLSAYYSVGNNNSVEVTVIDTTNNRDFHALYQQAVAEGNELVIGPLTKENVSLLYDMGDLPVPTLALNYVNDYGAAPRNLYQFGLAAEDEARQAALVASYYGHGNALVIAPDSEWGNRVAQAFTAAWEELDGQVINRIAFGSDTSYSAEIKSALQITDSELRARQLRQLLGASIEFTPRRRQDIDAVFLLAGPAQARALKPLLAFHYAGAIPVFATSHVYTGTPNAEKDADLNGITFTEMPWLLEREHPAWQGLLEFQPGMNRYIRLFGLGADAHRLYPRLPQLAVIPESTLAGNTGSLQMNSNGQVQRLLQVARFRRGLARALPDTQQNAITYSRREAQQREQRDDTGRQQGY